MNLAKAMDILTEHNKWRRGEPPYDTIPPVDHATPKEIGEAIDVAIEEMHRIAGLEK